MFCEGSIPSRSLKPHIVGTYIPNVDVSVVETSVEQLGVVEDVVLASTQVVVLDVRHVVVFAGDLRHQLVYQRLA